MLATVRFRVFWAAVPKQCSVNRRKGDQSPGVDLHEHPAAATVDEHHPRRVHADPVHTVNVVEADGDRIAVTTGFLGYKFPNIRPVSSPAPGLLLADEAPT